jgi:hypothetical protein
MTADQVKGKSFRGALRYNLEKVENKVAEVLDMSFSKLSENSIMKEVRMVRMQRPNLQKYFYHTSLNFPVHENLSNDAMLKIAHEYLEQNGFNQHQYLIVRHYDAEHPHVHRGGGITDVIPWWGRVSLNNSKFADAHFLFVACPH